MPSLRSELLFKSPQGNHYICARDKRQVLTVHPFLYHLAELGARGVDLAAWIGQLPSGQVRISENSVLPRSEVDYYYRKYLFLKRHGYFKPFEATEQFTCELDPQSVRHALANVRQVIFEVTDACNLRCAYCGYGKFYRDYDRRTDKMLDFKVAKRLLTFLADQWNSGLNTSIDSPIAIGFYGGEPLLNFTLIRDIVAYAKQLNAPRHPFIFTMTTNALLLAKHMDFLYEHRFALLISLDGHRHHNAYRVFPNGRPSHGQVVRNVRALKEKYPDYFKKYVNFNAVYHNRSCLKEVHDYFETEFGKTPMIGELNTAGIDPSSQDAFLETYASMAEDFEETEAPQTLIEDLFIDLPTLGSLSKFIHSYTDGSFSDYAELLAAKERSKRYPSGTCVPFERKIFLTVNHKILPCERIGHQYAVGHATADRVWLDPEGIAKTYSTHFSRLAELCQRCAAADNCGKCMFYIEWHSGKPRCGSFMSYDQRRSRFSSHLGELEKDPGIYARIVKEAVTK